MIDSLNGLVTPQLLGVASSRLGESESAVSKGLGAAFPMILAALMQKLNDPNLLSQLMSLLTGRANHTTEVLANPREALPGEAPGMTDVGGDLLSAVFGSQSGAVTSALGEYAGVKSSSASSLMTMGSTLVAGLLGDRVRRDHLSGAGLASLLSGQRSGILGALPGALSSLGALRGAGARATAAVRDTGRGGLGWLWALAALLLVIAIWALWGRGETAHVAVPTTNAVQRAGDAMRSAGQAASDTGQYVVAKLGAMTSRQLPMNITLNVPERGVESQVIAYLADPSKPVDPALWFNFDRLLFETGSATLKPESQEQLKNVAAILKAYPSVKVKIGGYTDNTGDSAANLKLSQERAANVRAALVNLGVAPDRVSAEGFGEQFPVADNSTEDGRQMNRRIALLVLEK
jgi:outer membrane protein OmpA-like peptidoglycan-associated protein